MEARWTPLHGASLWECDYCCASSAAASHPSVLHGVAWARAMPLAVSGCWRTVTMPQTRAHRPVGRSAAVFQPSFASFGRRIAGSPADDGARSARWRRSPRPPPRPRRPAPVPKAPRRPATAAQLVIRPPPHLLPPVSGQVSAPSGFADSQMLCALYLRFLWWPLASAL